MSFLCVGLVFLLQRVEEANGDELARGVSGARLVLHDHRLYRREEANNTQAIAHQEYAEGV